MNVFDFARMVEERRAELRLSLPRVTPSMWDNGGAHTDDPGTARTVPGPTRKVTPRMDDLTTPVNVPTSVYRYYDEFGTLIYVGITKRGTTRQAEHTHKDWWQWVSRQEIDHFPTREMAAQREADLIREFAPPFNKALNRGAEIHRANYMQFRSQVFTGSVREAVDALEKRLPVYLNGQSLEGTTITAEFTTDPRYVTLARSLQFPEGGVAIANRFGGVAGKATAYPGIGPFMVVNCMIPWRFLNDLRPVAFLRLKGVQTHRNKPAVVNVRSLQLGMEV